jgi:predicted aconitase with swiveling domain
MAKEYKGRVVVPGNVQAEALVTHTGFNTLANLKTAGSFLNRKGVLQDMNNPEIYGRLMPGKALCLPETIGSTTGGMVLYCASVMGVGPACMLFSKKADTLAVAGAVLTANWSEHPIVLVDDLGEEFLQEVKEGQMITVREDGTVIVEEA